MTALVIQARLDSTRLFRKSLLPLGGRPLIFRVMEALGIVDCEVKVLACPEDSAAAFAPLAEEAGFCLVPGPKEDVLARYCLAIKRFHPDRIIRVTGDNPFTFTDAAEFLNAEAAALGCDYAGYYGLPHGAGIESNNAEAMLRAEREASSPYDREHASPYLYNHPELFLVHRPLAPLRWQGHTMRVTVDTPEDYKRAGQLYAALSALPLAERNKGEAVIAAYRNIGL
ncbi:cytidylyltransferase domain-containing protein [Leadbettera azotonutricia]|uniref:Spore coat polysaccharide biosynthesis protein n=1 Tax=Leadbettera azotonutricia (strain ATCC BAA-888 / DSM 13862 / ZAS-9) TaxID=545695 RepID=F5Y6R3_LEAAZ|nr:NTP transferase domain-containing protein [Leadbettera azotonutricia]AEF83008.1 spore coat polysaccharide biosynthesis protein [Leadbettera azotonutricia ZAS-9]